MRELVRNFVRIVAHSFPIKDPIYEFGSLQLPGQEDFANLRSFFPNQEYVGCDFMEGPGVDKILDLEKIDLPDLSIATVLCLDTLEHVEHPHTALHEIHRILKHDGIAVLSSTMKFPIHNHPHDYWRFTPEAIRSLFRQFDGVFVGYAGETTFPHTLVALGFKGQQPPMNEFQYRYHQWRTVQENIESRWRTLKLFVPPILIRLVPPTLIRTAKMLRR